MKEGEVIFFFYVIPAKAGIQIENFCFSSLPNSYARYRSRTGFRLSPE
jgi:hypothetical protein